MSFDKYAKYAHSVEQPNDYYNQIDSDIVSESIMILDDKAQKIKSTPFEYFYEDIIQELLNIDITSEFKKEECKALKEDVIECLEICNEFHKMSSKKVNTWLQSSLKVVDYLVLHYIQVIRKDKPKKYDKLGVERSRYQHLQDYSEKEIKEVGIKLNVLYETRNSNEHRTRTNLDGTQVLVRPNRHKTRELVMDYFPVIMKEFKIIFSSKNLI